MQIDDVYSIYDALESVRPPSLEDTPIDTFPLGTLPTVWSDATCCGGGLEYRGCFHGTRGHMIKFDTGIVMVTNSGLFVAVFPLGHQMYDSRN